MLYKRFSLNYFLFLLLSLLIFASANVTFVQAANDNIFSTFDKAQEEKLRLAKEPFHNSTDFRNNQLLDEPPIPNDYKEISPKRYIVKFKDKAALQQISEIVNLYQYKLIGKSEQRTFMLELNDIEEFKQRTSGILELIEEDKQRRSAVIPSDPDFPYQWALPVLNLPGAWDINQGSNTVCVAVIDSGVYRSHPDFVGLDIRNGWDYVFGGICLLDSTGHGTNVTGIIGAETNNATGIAGVNWDVTIIPLRVTWPNGYAYESDLIAAIYDAADLGCKVINISMGGDSYSTSEKTAISYALSKGCIIVASAGNAGDSAYMYPASYAEVISVGSIDSDLSCSYFSEYNDRVDVTAPGTNIYTTSYWSKANGSDYLYRDGTSFSAPHVSGIAALAAALKPFITADDFCEALKETSTDLGITGYDTHYGYGLINAERLLRQIADQYYIQADSAPVEGGNITGTGSFALGSQITLTAAANAGYSFINWTENGVKVSTDPDYTLTVTTDRSLVANFEEDRSLYTEVESIDAVIPSKNWLVKFNEELDFSTINNKNIYITNSYGNIHPVIYANNDSNSLNTVQLTPQSAYTRGETYTIWIKNLKSASGKFLARWTLMDFTVQP